ncbi:MAG: proprotein convertase P-domain-containing protein, partial [Anaerolineae bacterium]
VTWSQKYQIESASFDHAYVDFREVGGANPSRLWEWYGATMTTGVGAVTVQESAGWGTRQRDLSSYAGQNTELVFHLDGDSSIQYAGLAVDDVSVTACQPAGATFTPTVTPTVTPTPTDTPTPTNTPTATPVPAGFTCSTPNVAIPDNNPTGVSDTLNVGSTGTLNDVNVFVRATHTWVGDTSFTVTHNATSVTVIDRPGVPLSTFGCSGDNITATLDDEAATPVENECAASVPTINGTFIPNNALSAFDGMDQSGAWTITAVDAAGGDTGVLVEWCVQTETSVPPTATPTDTATPEPATATPTDTATPEPLTATPTDTATPVPPTATPTATNTPTPIVGVIPPPPPLCTSATLDFANSTAVTIPTGPAVISSTLTVAGAAPYLWDLNLSTLINHTSNAQLDITLQSPQGTIVTISTDNGGTNDNGFAGTVWDDDANPGGQVPYVNNNGLVNDQLYVNLVTASPLVIEEALSAFIGEDPNGDWLLTISDDTTADGGTLNSWSLQVTTLDAAPSTASAASSNSTPVAITATGTPVVTSSIMVSGLPTFLTDLNMTA